jgi:hypothetical protein
MSDPQHEETFADTERKLREIITTLRAQLAEVQAERDGLAVDLGFYTEDRDFHKARATLAEIKGT